MSGLLSGSTKVDSHLDSLFKNSVNIIHIILVFFTNRNFQAGESKLAVKPILAEEVTANVEKKNKSKGKKDGQKAFLGFKKAQALMAATQKVNTKHDS